jgi:phenylalanyl-tRNA synthetase beta chain
VEGAEVGAVGEIHPSILASLKLLRGACALEISLADLKAHYRASTAKRLPEYPPMVRDVALLVPESQDAEPLLEALRSACGPLAEDVRLFDIYRGEGIPSGKKSFAFTVGYRAKDRTLTDSEIDAVHGKATAEVAGRFNVTVR